MGKIVKGITNIFGGKPVDTSQAAFKPYALTTPGGSSYFDTKTGTGGINLSPDLQSMWDSYIGGAQGALPSEEQMQSAGAVSDYGMGLWDKAANLDTQGIAKDYLGKQMALLEPGRAQESSRLNDLMFSRGTLGAGVGMGEGYINPQQYALQQSRGQQDLELALASTDRSRTMQNEDLQRALGFYGMGQELKYQPYQQSANILGYGTELQNLAMPALQYGIQSGQASASAGANMAQLQQKARDSNMSFWGGLLSGGMNKWG
jgi:hypothetical protein